VAAWTVIVKVAFDSIPEIRRVILAMLLARSEPMTMSKLESQGQIKCARTTLNRAMEELKVHGLIEADAKVGGEEKPYCATEWSRMQYRLAGLENPNRTKK
jgi:predicted transcriptional regulator